LPEAIRQRWLSIGVKGGEGNTGTGNAAREHGAKVYMKPLKKERLHANRLEKGTGSVHWIWGRGGRLPFTSPKSHHEGIGTASRTGDLGENLIHGAKIGRSDGTGPGFAVHGVFRFKGEGCNRGGEEGGGCAGNGGGGVSRKRRELAKNQGRKHSEPVDGKWPSRPRLCTKGEWGGARSTAWGAGEEEVARWQLKKI